MTILVTGATGRIGSVLTRTLIERGEHVRALALEGDPLLARLDDLDVEITLGDLSSGSGLLEACTDVDAVVHLGALMAWTQADWPRLFEINLRGTFNLLQAVVDRSPDVKRFILASTDASYPASGALYSPVDEHHPQVPVTFYGMTKQADEIMCQFYGRKLGMPVVRARQQEALALLESLQPSDGSERLLIPYGEDGRVWKYTLYHVQDLADAILLLLSREEAVGEVFNLGPSAPFTLDVAVKYLSKITTIPYVEARLPGPPVTYTVDTSKVRAMLGYEPKYDIFAILDEAAQFVTGG